MEEEKKQPKEDEEDTDLEPEDVTEKENTGAGLLIRMEVSAQKGLRAIPEWRNLDNSRISVYAKEAAEVEDCDRPALMRFVAEAGKYGFEFQKGVGEFLLGTQHIRRVTKARQGATFIRGHGLVRLDQAQVEDFEWWQRNRGDAKRAQWPRYMLFSLFARKYLRTRADGQLDHWRESIKALDTNGVGKKFTFLRPYQKQGVAHLHALHSLGCHPLLADEMGLGKTMQTLALLSSQTSQDLPDLVTCPASVVPVWVKEAAKHFPKLKVRILRKEETFDQTDEPCLWVASYTQLRRHRHLLDKVEFRYAVLDEAQLIKNPKAKVTQACLSIEARNRLALSGTPIA